MQIETPCTPVKLGPQNMVWEVTPSKLLADESPLIILPQLACKVGDRHATILQQLHYLTLNLRGRVVGGKKWIRIQLRKPESDEEGEDNNDLSWQGMLPYLSHSTIGKYLSELKAEGLIESKVFKGRGLHYWLNVEAVNALIAPVERIKALQKTKLNNMTIAPNRGNQSLKSRQSKPLVAAIKAPSRGASKIVKNQSKTQKRIKDSAPKNGAAESGENSLADSPQNQSAEANVNSGAVTAPPSSENPPPADKPRSPAQLAHDAKMTAFAEELGLDINIKSARGKILKAIGELNKNYGETVTPDLISRVIGTLKNPETGYIPEPAKVVEKWLSVTETLTAMDTQKGVIDQIKAICLEPTGGWQSQATSLVAIADRIIAKDWQSKLDGFTWWGEGQPTIKAFTYALPEFISKKEQSHGTINPLSFAETASTASVATQETQGHYPSRLSQIQY